MNWSVFFVFTKISLWQKAVTPHHSPYPSHIRPFTIPYPSTVRVGRVVIHVGVKKGAHTGLWRIDIWICVKKKTPMSIISRSAPWPCQICAKKNNSANGLPKCLHLPYCQLSVRHCFSAVELAMLKSTSTTATLQTAPTDTSLTVRWKRLLTMVMFLRNATIITSAFTSR